MITEGKLIKHPARVYVVRMFASNIVYCHTERECLPPILRYFDVQFEAGTSNNSPHHTHSLTSSATGLRTTGNCKFFDTLDELRLSERGLGSE